MKSTALAFVALIASVPALAGEATLAVATNFYKVAQNLTEEFEAATGHRILLAPGSTGKLYAQIINGAPFDLFLAADAERPRILEQAGRIVPGSRKTYAIGRLALIASDGRDLSDIRAALQSGQRLAVADADLAPYGQAAAEILDHLELGAATANHLVIGESIGQAYSFVATGNAKLGLVALTQAQSGDLPNWVVIPSEWHRPIRQDMVLVARPKPSEAALAFHSYLQSEVARAVIRAAGYEVAP